LTITITYDIILIWRHCMGTEVTRAGEITQEEQIARSFVPWPRDDLKSRYLGLMCSGFSLREACKYLGIGKSAVSNWRTDPKFVDAEQHIPEYRKALSREYLNLEFIRNFRLLLEKDKQVAEKAIHPDLDENGKPMPMGSQDHSYLLKMRQAYTPQQLQALQAIAGGSLDGFNWTDLLHEAGIIQVKREDTVTFTHNSKGDLDG
jgi:hypothetical protein